MHPLVLPLVLTIAVLSAAQPQNADITRLPRTPIAFVANAGQWHSDVAYRARFGSLTAFLEANGFLIDCRRDLPVGAEPLAPETVLEHAALRWTFSGRPKAMISERQLAARHSYFVGSAESWRTDLSTCEAVRYDEVHPGIDVVVYAKDFHFEYDVECAAGSDLDAIAFTITGAEGLTLRGDGVMLVHTSVGDVIQTAPLAFVIDRDGKRKDVAMQFAMRGPERFGFQADWDGEGRLVIDPGILYGTYVGGSGTENCNAVDIDAAGVITIAGTTQSANYPITTGAYSTTLQAQDVYVTSLDPTQTASNQLVMSTFLGGSLTDNVSNVTVDEFGFIWVAGATQSSDFPTSSNAFQAAHGGGNDAFLVVLNPFAAGSAQLFYSTFIGGSGTDGLFGFALENGVATLCGSTTSATFPTTLDAWSPLYAGGSSDGYIAQIDPSLPLGFHLIYATLFGGSGQDVARAVHANGSIVTVTGNTASPNFPSSANAMQLTGGGGTSEAYVFQLYLSMSSASQLVYASYLGGSSSEFGQGVSVDDAGTITLFGTTMSPDFPTTPGAFGVGLNGTGTDAYIVRIQPILPPAQQLLYGTFAGGSSGESAARFVIDRAGVVTFCGGGSSQDFPTTPDSFAGAAPGGANDGYVCRIDPSRPQAQQLVYSTYVGGTAQDGALALAANELEQIVVVGFTQSTTFPTTPGAFSASPSGLADTFVLHLDMLPAGVSTFGTSSAGCQGPVVASVSSNPSLGNPLFEVSCLGMQSPTLGVFGLSPNALSTPIDVLGAQLWLSPVGALVYNLATAPEQSAIHLSFPVPAIQSLVGFRLHGQFFWLEPTTPSPCPMGGFSASNALTIEVQP